jgi:DNA repair protein RadC
MPRTHPKFGDDVVCVREIKLAYGAGKPAPALLDPERVASFARTIIAPGADREQFAVIPLDARHRPLGWRIVSIGTLTAALVHPREVFRPVLVLGAAAVVAAVVHNHPSGDPTPSVEDERLTVRLIAAGRLLGVELLDHVVLGDRDAAFSFRVSRPEFFAAEPA